MRHLWTLQEIESIQFYMIFDFEIGKKSILDSTQFKKRSEIFPWQEIQRKRFYSGDYKVCDIVTFDETGVLFYKPETKNNRVFPCSKLNKIPTNIVHMRSFAKKLFQLLINLSLLNSIFWTFVKQGMVISIRQFMSQKYFINL